jgi:cell division protein FtsI (penicillin-binding protein 3)
MGQEIGISPLQLAQMVSTIGNDGVLAPPRIVAASQAFQNTPQTVIFRPASQLRVLSPMTAAQMKQMMQGVVLHGTGRKAVLEGYSSAGKTGTAQKVDPATGAYSHTKYVASFAGFAPINNPAITVAVILDSAVGLHQGGQVAAPVFQRVAQQVLEYLHVPHDVELPPNRQQWLAERRVKEEDLSESSPDHLGASLEVAEGALSESPVPLRPGPSLSGGASVQSQFARSNAVVPAALREAETAPAAANPPTSDAQTGPALPPKLPAGGTVVLDVETGGIEVPSFLGKSVRAAIEAAEDNGLELDAVGNGIARDQSPLPGTHVAAGTHITVQFQR